MEREGNVEKAILAEMARPGSMLIERVTRHNQIILHNYRQATERRCECRLLGCPESFDVTLIPNQVLYPKYCEDHRSEFRRENFLKRFTSRPDEFRFGNVRVLQPAH